MSSKSTPKGIPDALQHFDLLPSAAFVKQPVVEALFACSPATLWRRVKSGEIPAPDKLSERSNGWNVGRLRAKLATYAS
jgi:predicted DNA-binding transcriptional regulator AlpA